MSSGRPELDTDLYTDQAILDPYPSYRAIRDRGPAVWLTAHQTWAIGRFHDVRASLLASDVLLYGHGVHRCAGAFLAQLEMQSLLRAMAARVERIEVGEPEVALNNVLRGYASFAATFRPLAARRAGRLTARA